MSFNPITRRPCDFPGCDKHSARYYRDSIYLGLNKAGFPMYEPAKTMFFRCHEHAKKPITRRPNKEPVTSEQIKKEIKEWLAQHPEDPRNAHAGRLGT